MKIKKLLTVFVGVALTLSLTGCGFSIGTSGESGDYSDVFTDPITSGKIHTMKSYQFTVGDYGSTTVYVDTTDGASFELVETPAGFTHRFAARKNRRVCKNQSQHHNFLYAVHKCVLPSEKEQRSTQGRAGRSGKLRVHRSVCRNAERYHFHHRIFDAYRYGIGLYLARYRQSGTRSVGQRIRRARPHKLCAQADRRQEADRHRAAVHRAHCAARGA